MAPSTAIAWRSNCLVRLERALHDLPADLLFESDEWHAAFILNKKPVPKEMPTLYTVVRILVLAGARQVNRTHPITHKCPRWRTGRQDRPRMQELSWKCV